MVHFFHDCFVPEVSQRTDPRVSPSRADPAEFPLHITLVTASGDVFSPETVELGEKLKDGQRKVVVKTLEGLHHGFTRALKRERKSGRDEKKRIML